MKKYRIKLFSLFIVFLLLFPVLVSAADYTFIAPLPGMPKTAAKDMNPAEYVQYLFILGLYLLSFLAVGFIALGGIMWMLAAGNPGRIDKAKEMIVGALSGLVLLLCSYLILNTIDPSLTNIKAPTLEKYDIEAVTEEFDVPAKDMSESDMAAVAGGRIAGAGSIACAMKNCGSQTVQGHQLSTGGAGKYLSLKQEIENACATRGLNCSAQLTSTVTGQHSSSCHNAASAKGGTCGDFVIISSACNGSVKNCDPTTREKYTQIATTVLNGSKNTTSCLNEYKITTKYTTGGHFHCNF